MRTTSVRSHARGRSARWHVKKHDDALIERWTLACSIEHGDCRGCEFVDRCQDLADRLIGCMGVPATGHWKQPRYDSTSRRATREQAILRADDSHRDTLRVPVATLR